MEEKYILIAEDDTDDQFLFKAAFHENGFTELLQFVENGIELMNFLNALKRDNVIQKFPRLILLDLNMPKKNGKEVLAEIKEDEMLKKIPLVVFSTTNNEQEKKKCYELGADLYITKPNSFEELISTIGKLNSFSANA